jgi:hypothetical protein
LQLSQTAVKIPTQYVYVNGALLFLPPHLTARRAVDFALLGRVRKAHVRHSKNLPITVVTGAKKKKRMMDHVSMK